MAKDQFDWRGPASGRRLKPFSVRLKELFIPPKGEKVLPTASGMMLILVGLCLGLAAYNTGNNVLFVALALVVSSIILSGVFCWTNFMSARWRLEASPTFRVGEEGYVDVVLENARQMFPLLATRFDVDRSDTGEGAVLFSRDSLAPGESSRLRWHYRPARRGVASFRIVEARSSFPFGFICKHLAGECALAARVWPARIEYERLAAPNSGFGWQGASSKKMGLTGELAGLRGYREGDAMRSVHWKVSARQRKLVVKEHVAESQARYVLEVDPSGYLWSSEQAFEKMCSLAATLAEDLFLAGDLDCCGIAGEPLVKVGRVADLESFFDSVAALKWEAGSKASPLERRGQAIVFKQLGRDSVGAVIDGTTIAQA